MQFGADFDALIERFSPDPDLPIAIAVSGGSDSTAVLCLADKWATRQQRRLQVFTVDHGLRAEARAEARWVSELCQSLGHPHQTLIWTTPRPSQNAAREARYRLLCQAARSTGAAILLVGHTLNDVVETALIRRRRGVRDSSVAGPVLASAPPVWPEGRGLTILRPLLDQTRLELRHYLTRNAQCWLDDPSNEQATYERVRIRQTLQRQSTLASFALAQVQRLQKERCADDCELGVQLSKVRINSDGLIETGNAQISTRLVTLLARCASGGDQDARAQAIGNLRASLSEQGSRQTLGGAWFQRTAGGFLIGRDPGEATHSAIGGLFDGRFEAVESAGHLAPEGQSFLVRESAPPGPDWREIISERLAHLAKCYQTPRLRPVQT